MVISTLSISEAAALYITAACCRALNPINLCIRNAKINKTDQNIDFIGVVFLMFSCLVEEIESMLDLNIGFYEYMFLFTTNVQTSRFCVFLCLLVCVMVVFLSAHSDRPHQTVYTICWKGLRFEICEHVVKVTYSMFSSMRILTVLVCLKDSIGSDINQGFSRSSSIGSDPELIETYSWPMKSIEGLCVHFCIE